MLAFVYIHMPVYTSMCIHTACILIGWLVVIVVAAVMIVVWFCGL